jgi:hypothetical protein
MNGLEPASPVDSRLFIVSVIIRERSLTAEKIWVMPTFC